MLVGRGKECSFLEKGSKKPVRVQARVTRKDRSQSYRKFFAACFKNEGLCSDGRPAG
jgi:hypothetical protein